ncbi:restriction endonuclease subunit S [Streptococcus equinus]|uniref:restriction endonuclease subunit S n=1 Tax=Streptococcus equinus TaxID=1335 RepID=UPI003C701B33
MRLEESWVLLDMSYKLEDICSYVKEKIDVSVLDEHTYISTGNMIPDKGGITEAASLPSADKTQAFKAGDVLVSNIRPYFKKIWYATFDGGCSNDVLVFRANDGISKRFLFYVLADDAFFAYSMSTSKGTKMPRGDKKALMKYDVPNIAYDDQVKIASILDVIDDKIIVNKEINDNLLQQTIASYEHLIQDDEWPIATILDIADKVAMGPFGSNIKVSTFVPEGVPIISGNHLRSYFLEEPEFNYITEDHAERLKNSIVYPHDLVFTHAGNIGQVSMIPDGSKYDYYVLSQRQFYLRCDETKVVPEFLLMFFHSSLGQHELLSYANQTGVPSIAQPATNLKKIPFKCPPLTEQLRWKDQVQPMIQEYINNRAENERLAELRDALLPKLMSGELDISNLDL